MDGVGVLEISDSLSLPLSYEGKNILFSIKL